MGLHRVLGFPGGSVIKNPHANAGDLGSIHGPERTPGEGNGNPLNPTDRGAWWLQCMRSQRVSHDLVIKQ